MRRLLTHLMMVICLVFPSVLFAQAWQPTEPEKDAKDWVQLVSGEWIKGNIDLIRDLTLYFDSDELDELELDWADVAAFRSPRELTYAFENRAVVTGPATMRDGTIRITTAAGVVEKPRRHLLSVIEGHPKEINFWSAKANLGVTIRSGNTDQNDGALTVKIKRDAMRSRLNLSYQGNTSEVKGEKTAESQRFNADYNLFLSRKFYITIPSVEFYSDRFQNIDYRYSGNVGAGYHFYRRGDLDWSAGLGFGHQTTRYISVQAGEDPDYETISMTPNTSFEMDLTEDIELNLYYSAMVGLKDIKQTTHHLYALISVDFLWDIFELTSSVTWDHNESPTANSDGVVPEKDDLLLTVGFGIDL